MAAGRVFVVMLVCLLLWAFLFAPTLKRAAEASSDGARRTVALVVLAPFAAISDTLQITKLTDGIERALGRDPDAAPGGEIVIPPEPIPSVSQGGGGDVETKGPIRKPTGQNKLRVVVVGDSLASGVGTYLERVLKPGLARVSRQGRISTGLARPDYFNWPSAMREIADRYRPDLVIVMLGENDNQPLRTPGGQLDTDIGTFAWPQAYEQRVAGFMRIATSRGARVVWVGLPVVRDTERRDLVRRQNDLFEQAAQEVKNVSFLDTWKLYSTPDGGYTAYIHVNGNVVQIREADGIHFNSTGYELLARAAVALAEKDFKLTPRVEAG
jgi:hypothetical protein